MHPRGGDLNWLPLLPQDHKMAGLLILAVASGGVCTVSGIYNAISTQPQEAEMDFVISTPLMHMRDKRLF